MASKKNGYADIAELICELTRNCNIKEEYFAAGFNLSPTEVRLLKLFTFEESCSVREIRERLNLTPGRITHILKSLEKKKIVERFPDEKDKRNVHVRLLSKAQPLIQNLHQNYNRLHEDLLKNVNGMEMKYIHDSLVILVDVFKKWIEVK